MPPVLPLTTTDMILQAVIGLVIVIIMFILSSIFMRIDTNKSAAANDLQKQQETKLIHGWKMPLNEEQRLNISQPNRPGYVPVRKSVNQMGGLQYSYSFWFLRETGWVPSNDNIVLLAGDNTKYDYSVGSAAYENKYAIFNPMIKLQNNEVHVLINTLHNVRETVSTAPSANSQTLTNAGATWTMITVVVEDNKSYDGFENGILVQIYVDNVLNMAKHIRSTLKSNHGDLFLYPASEMNASQRISGCKIGNLSYFNYALSAANIQQRFMTGIPRFEASRQSSVDLATLPNYVSLFNQVRFPQ